MQRRAYLGHHSASRSLFGDLGAASGLPFFKRQPLAACLLRLVTGTADARGTRSSLVCAARRVPKCARSRGGATSGTRSALAHFSATWARHWAPPFFERRALAAWLPRLFLCAADARGTRSSPLRATRRVPKCVRSRGGAIWGTSWFRRFGKRRIPCRCGRLWHVIFARSRGLAYLKYAAPSRSRESDAPQAPSLPLRRPALPPRLVDGRCGSIGDLRAASGPAVLRTAGSSPLGSRE